jgi:putative flippase GtrA
VVYCLCDTLNINLLAISVTGKIVFVMPSSSLPPATLAFKLKQLYPQLRGFVFAGLVGTLIDYGFYHLYDQWLPPLFSKGLAFSSATIFVYVMNKFWTFKQPLHSRREVAAFFALYTVSMLVNTTVNSLALQYFPHFFHTVGVLPLLLSGRMVKLLAFLMATGTSTVINFIGQKFWVFELKNKQLAKK